MINELASELSDINEDSSRAGTLIALKDRYLPYDYNSFRLNQFKPSFPEQTCELKFSYYMTRVTYLPCSDDKLLTSGL